MTTTTAKVTKPIVGHCLKCRRPLRNASPDGYGPKCRVMVRKAARARVVAQYKPHQVAKAEELLEQGGLIPLRANRVFLAVSSDGSATYKVHRAACTCPAGIKGVHPCKHRIAAHIVSLAA
ncbi:SWIM zinc finger family protein [Streptomyces sp. SRF1]|uniref:SWIM zinc finger family protein n=1 Tax=Streptomyces sp. SRF1 TaxID=1549642 RepID=UPI0025AF9517|nr:SWIM zinc finger family protein [Streptomyces sp. SRF1]MDN3056880.1 SWIM zinc finger family protein [Streptomyces sp. SRF1]